MQIKMSLLNIIYKNLRKQVLQNLVLSKHYAGVLYSLFPLRLADVLTSELISVFRSRNMFLDGPTHCNRTHLHPVRDNDSLGWFQTNNGLYCEYFPTPSHKQPN